jgi:hypothetical protein
VIAEQVLDIAAHERLLGSGGYRPAGCIRCGGPMHIHEYRERVLAGDPAQSTEIALFRCADRQRCGAVMRVLPAFIARRLWRTWTTVEQATLQDNSEAEERARSEVVPERTRRRWQARLAASAAAIVVVLAVAAGAVPFLREVISRVGLDGTRAELVVEYVRSTTRQLDPGEKLAAVSAVVHRLAPGMRLM